MIEFCVGAPTRNLFKTCLEIYQEAWWLGLGTGVGLGVIGFVTVAIIVTWMHKQL